jgi:hypothetical protein
VRAREAVIGIESERFPLPLSGKCGKNEEGIASLLLSTRYKVIAATTHPAELEHSGFAARRLELAIIGMDETVGEAAEIAERIALLRSLLTGARVIIVAETNEPLATWRASPCLAPMAISSTSVHATLPHIGSHREGSSQRILRKTNARNRTQAAIWAIEHGFRESGHNASAAVASDAPNLSPAEPSVRIKPELVVSKS